MADPRPASSAGKPFPLLAVPGNTPFDLLHTIKPHYTVLTNTIQLTPGTHRGYQGLFQNVGSQREALPTTTNNRSTRGQLEHRSVNPQQSELSHPQPLLVT
jgi:hypothetical protein